MAQIGIVSRLIGRARSLWRWCFEPGPGRPGREYSTTWLLLYTVCLGAILWHISWMSAVLVPIPLLVILNELWKRDAQWADYVRTLERIAGPEARKEAEARLSADWKPPF